MEERNKKNNLIKAYSEGMLYFFKKWINKKNKLKSNKKFERRIKWVLRKKTQMNL